IGYLTLLVSRKGCLGGGSAGCLALAGRLDRTGCFGYLLQVGCGFFGLGRGERSLRLVWGAVVRTLCAKALKQFGSLVERAAGGSGPAGWVCLWACLVWLGRCHWQRGQPESLILA